MGIFDFLRKKVEHWLDEEESVHQQAEGSQEKPQPDPEPPKTAKAATGNEEDKNGFARSYMVELLYATPPLLSEEKILAKMRTYIGESNDSVRLTTTDKRPDVGSYQYALQQSWHWPDAGATVEQCQYMLLISDECTTRMGYKERLEAMQKAIQAVLKIAPCDAIYWRASEKLVQPAAYAEALASGQLLYGALNVRLYNMPEESSGRREMLVDTCGLAALGIPDVQCHFFDLDPNHVASFLGELAWYMFDQEDQFTDGEWIGEEGEQRWRCERQRSLAEPPRTVIDLAPAPPYYAGTQRAANG